MEQDNNPARSFWRSRRGWITAHFLGGIAAAAIGFGLMFAISLAVLSIATPQVIALGATLMTVAALAALAPLIAYQSWALRRAVAPWAWWLAWTAAILSAPLIMAAVRPVMATASGSYFVYSNGIAGTILAGLWGASLQWCALRGRVQFARWIAGAGIGLTLVSLAAGSGLVAGLLIAWMVTLPPALGLYGASTWRSVEGLITEL